jgi:3-oxoadipate enol-lactonase
MDVKLHREVAGSGEPLFLLNGIMMTTATWQLQTRVLAETYQCVLHDFRGQLRSDKPPGPYSMQTHVDDLAALMDELQIERAHLVGTSYGGEVGMMFAGSHPDRVRTLSAIACVSRVDDALRAGVVRWAETARNRPHELWAVALPHNYSPAFIAANPAFIEAGRQRVSALPREWFDALADLCEAFTTLDVRLGKITCPTLVVVGEHDALKPVSASQEIAAGIADSRLVVIEDAGHAVVIEKPDAVNAALLEFLSGATTTR